MHLTLHLTDRCNLACRYCYARHGSIDMTLEAAISAIQHCATASHCGIIFFGGEPLLCQPLIWRIMDWCETHDPGRFHYKVTTNGTLMDDAFLDEAMPRDLHVALSCDGIREAHDAFRVTPEGGGTFAMVRPALKRLLALRPYSPIMMTVNPSTVPFLSRSVMELQEEGVRYLILSLNYAAEWTDAHLRKLKKEFLTLSQWHEENYSRRRKFYFSPFDKRMASHIFPERGSSCRLGKRQISVGPDGRLFPCVQFVGRDNYCIGTAATGIDEEKREHIFRLNEQEKPECVGCALDGRCHNKCGCLNIQTTGCIEKLPSILCEVERILFPIADALAERLFQARNELFMQRHYNPAFPILSFLEDVSAG